MLPDPSNHDVGTAATEIQASLSSASVPLRISLLHLEEERRCACQVALSTLKHVSPNLVLRFLISTRAIPTEKQVIQS